jgi:hypothetical protein
MAGTERDGPTDGDVGSLDDSDAEPDSIDDEEDGGLLAGVASALGRGDRDDEAKTEADVEDEGPKLTEKFLEDARELQEAIGERLDDEETGPVRAELVDGAQVLFIDPAARSKALYEYDLVLITAPQYPEPVVLKNDVPIEVPEGVVLCSSEGATMIDYAGKRVIQRSYILVPPSRADEVSPDHREEVPEALVGKTIPTREVQNEEFYNLVLNAAAAPK